MKYSLVGALFFVIFSMQKLQAQHFPHLDSIASYVDEHCKNDTCRLLDKSFHREVFYKKLNDGRVILVFDFLEHVDILHERHGQWEQIDRVPWDFVSAFAEFKRFNSDEFDDLVLYGELDQYGNSKSYVYLYHAEHDHLEHFPRYDLINFDYDTIQDVYKSAHYEGYHHEAYQALYHLRDDTLHLFEKVYRGEDDVTYWIKNVESTHDTVRVPHASDSLWNNFGATNWFY